MKGTLPELPPGSGSVFCRPTNELAELEVKTAEHHAERVHTKEVVLDIGDGIGGLVVYTRDVH